MPSTILSDNGVSSGTAGVKTTGSNDGILELQTTTAGGTATTAITIDTGQRSKFPTTIGVGGATPSTSGSGISFPATASASSDANTLDDYEEGTWSPSIGGTATYTTQLGRYTKIGRTVIVNFTLKINVIGTGSIYTINNLPFTSQATVTQWGYVGNYTSIATASTWLYAYIDPSSTNLSFGGTASALATTAVPVTVWQNGAEINATAVYFT